MAQSSSGKIISELRIQQGITQKDLSEKCNIDIRTVQRIECDEVIPRFSTPQLIADALNVNIDTLREKNGYQRASHHFYRFTWIIGIIQFLNLIPLVFWKDYQSTLMIGSLNIKVFVIFPLLHIVLGILFYFGFYVLGKHRKIKPLVISAIVLIIIIPVSEILLILNLFNVIAYSGALGTAIAIIIGINRIIFGVGILQIRNSYKRIVFITGILLIFTGLLYIIPNGSIRMTGTLLYYPVIILLILLLFRESKELHQTEGMLDGEENQN